MKYNESFRIYGMHNKTVWKSQKTEWKWLDAHRRARCDLYSILFTLSGSPGFYHRIQNQRKQVGHWFSLILDLVMFLWRLRLKNVRFLFSHLCMNTGRVKEGLHIYGELYGIKHILRTEFLLFFSVFQVRMFISSALVSWLVIFVSFKPMLHQTNQIWCRKWWGFWNKEFIGIYSGKIAFHKNRYRYSNIKTFALTAQDYVWQIAFWGPYLLFTILLPVFFVSKNVF